MTEPNNFWDFIVSFAFQAPGEVQTVGYTPERPWNALAFSILSAGGFFAFVIVDFSVFMVRLFGFQAEGAGEMKMKHGLGTIIIIIFGCLGAFVIGGLAAIIGFFQVNAQTAIVAGVTWQLVYAKVLTHMRNTTSGSPAPERPKEVQKLATEEAE